MKLGKHGKVCNFKFMKRKAIVATLGEKDSQNDIFSPDCFKEKTIVPLLMNFDNSKFLGKVKVEKDRNYLFAEIDDATLEGLYPAIGFQIIESHREGDIRVIDEIKLYAVGVSPSPNVDVKINPI